jgi:hypothetical protein
MRHLIASVGLLLCASTGFGEWTLHKAPDANFQASFPAEPEVSVQTITTETGAIPYTTYMAELAGGAIAFGVAYNDYPADLGEADAEKVLDSGRDGARENLSGRLISETKMQHRGHPAREFTIVSEVDGQTLFYHTRLMLIGNRLYQLQVVRVGDVPVDIADVVKFFASFEQIQPTPPPGK